MYNTIYPVNIKPYVPPQQKKQVGASGEETSQSKNLQRENQALQDSERRESKKGFERQELPNGKKTTIDYSRCQVNIAQIITDFKNTAQAIGTPDDIVQEVDMYLALAEAQSLKDEPNKKLIQANLRNASEVLDSFISETLNKKSKVVYNWVEALFLQQVNYKSDPNSINPDFLVQLPGKDNSKQLQQAEKNKQEKELKAEAQQKPQILTAGASATSVESVDTVQAQSAELSKIYIPSDPELKKSFIQGKKYAAVNDSQKALAAFSSALSQAQKIDDKQAESMVCFEMGQIYDKEDNLEEALKYYNASLINSTDNNLKAKAYYSMAQIYDDVVYFEPAMNHYYAAISFAGEAENMNAQTKALSDIANMFAQRYDKDKTIEYFDVAKIIAGETKENKTIGAVYSKSGDTMRKLEENVAALNDYKESAKYYQKADSSDKVARNYEKASQVMSKLGNSIKAKSLLEKAYNIALSVDNQEYAKELSQQFLQI